MSKQPDSFDKDDFDKYGFFVNEEAGYRDTLLRLYDLEEQAHDLKMLPDAQRALYQARLLIIAEFKAKFPGADAGRGLWERSELFGEPPK